MDQLPTLPRRTWLERASLILAAGLLVLGGAGLVGWWSGMDALVWPLASFAPIKANECLCFLILGAILLCREFGKAEGAWAALVTGSIALLTLAESVTGDLHIDEMLARDHILVETAQPGRASLMATACIALASVALILHVIDRTGRKRLFVEAVSGSVVASVGCSTLLGYAASLPSVYNWGTETATAPLAAAGLLLLGSAILLVAWRESQKENGGPPAWAPMPAVIVCITLTLILWIGLRERELVYIASRTEGATDQLFSSLRSEIAEQTNSFDHIARKWADGKDGDTAEWDADSKQQFDESREFGCVSVSNINAELRTIWVFPKAGNEGAIDFDHLSEAARREAIEAARTQGLPTVSATIDIHGVHNAGYAVYAPIVRGGTITGYVSGEFLYEPLLRALISRLKILGDYDIAVLIGGNTVFDTSPGEERHGPIEPFDRIYPFAGGRVHLTLTPRPETISRERRFLPELALIAGFGITILLGLSVHLARRARSGQHLAELSNKRLLAENEERRRIEARLKVSDERLRLALDSTQMGIFEWNVPGGHVYHSPGLWTLLGYEPGRMPSTVEAWQALIHPDDLQAYRRRIESQLNGIAAFIDPEYRVRARTGEWRWVYARSKSVATGPNGKPSRIIGTVQDITARRGAEQALRESQAEARKLSLVASKTDNLVIIGSADGRIEWVNAAFCRVMEYSLEEIVGRDPGQVLAGPETDPRVIEQIRTGITRGQSVNTEIIHYSKSGRKYHLHLEIQVVRGQTGQVENFIAIETDITARVETENQLRRAKAEADAVSRAKSEFLASMSHEIRTPMNGVIGMTSLLMETPLNAEQRDFVNTIRTSGEALLTIINDILDFSKIESGKMELERAPFDLSLCIEEALDLFALHAFSKNVEIGCSIDAGVPAWVVGDVTRLRQVIVNLVNNAVKFTPSGSISVDARMLDPGPAAPGGHAPRPRLEIAVSDTGIGIPPDRIQRLFKAFSQVDSSTTRKYGGTGLGLAICQRLCHLMGGDIRVESAPGKGSSFIITVATEAAVRPADSAPPPASAIPIRGGLVLCIEDNPTTRSRLRSLIEGLGGTCAFANNLEAAAQMTAVLPTPPALLVVDWVESDGQAALDDLAVIKCPRLLLHPLGQAVPVGPADGCPYATLTKPLRTAALHQALAGITRSGSRGSADSGGKAVTHLLAEEIPLNILLAEDNPVNQKVAKRFMERLGYQADAVANGIEAVTALESRRYDLILMDLQMPEMDGLEASRQIRRRLPPDRQPKIIALTANAMQGDREICLAAGMDDYVSKPVKMHEIEAAIRRQFTAKVDGGHAAEAAGEAAGEKLAT